MIMLAINVPAAYSSIIMTEWVNFQEEIDRRVKEREGQDRAVREREAERKRNIENVRKQEDRALAGFVRSNQLAGRKPDRILQSWRWVSRGILPKVREENFVSGWFIPYTVYEVDAASWGISHHADYLVLTPKLSVAYTDMKLTQRVSMYTDYKPIDVSEFNSRVEHFAWAERSKITKRDSKDIRQDYTLFEDRNTPESAESSPIIDFVIEDLERNSIPWVEPGE